MTSKTNFLLIAILLTGTAFGAATGRIVGPDGAAIPDAEVCESPERAPGRCSPVDSHGAYRIEKPLSPTLLVRARGFVSTTVDAAPLAAPVQLQRAAVLLVVVVDADTRVPVASGRVMIDSPSGKRIGEFVPFNKNGVRISTLDPGDVFVRVEATGYTPSGPVPVELVSGAERSLTVPLKKKR